MSDLHPTDRQPDQWDPWESTESPMELSQEDQAQHRHPQQAPVLPEFPPDLNPALESPMELSQGDQASTSPPGHDEPETHQVPDFPDYYHTMNRSQKKDWRKRHPVNSK